MNYSSDEEYDDEQVDWSKREEARKREEAEKEAREERNIAELKELYVSMTEMRTHWPKHILFFQFS